VYIYLEAVVVYIFRQQILYGFGGGRSNFTGLNNGTIPSRNSRGQRGQAEKKILQLNEEFYYNF
jgi:hypothetical protein